MDNLSNQVPELIRQQKFGKAETVCRQLLEQYSEQIDGLHRFAELYETQGENQKAAEYYRKTVHFAEQASGFDQESIDFFRKRAEELAV